MEETQGFSNCTLHFPHSQPLTALVQVKAMELGVSFT